MSQSAKHPDRSVGALTAEAGHHDTDRQLRLEAAMEEVAHHLERGDSIDRQALLSKYADIADELSECLANVDFIQTIAPQLREAPSESSQEEPHGTHGVALGDFRILKEIGRGGMGVVYEAEQLSIGRRVALKVLPFAAMLDKHQLNRFKNEARAAGTLDHPHIVSVFAVGEERGVHYYAMRLVQGQSLAEVLEQLRAKSGRSHDESDREPLATADVSVDPTADTARVAQAALSTHAPFDVHEHCRSVASLGIQAAQALAHAHANGILHRDVKPANLLVDGEGMLYVTDFGLARIQTDTDLSVTGDVLGTLRYMSPEQASGQHTLLDARTDIYSLGVSMYELLTLTPAIQGRERADLIRSVMDAEPVAPRKLNAAIPKDLETIVVKSIAKEPEERYSTMLDLAEDLQRFLDSEPIHARRPRLSYLVSRWIRRHAYLVGGVFAVLLLFAAGTFLAWQREIGLRRSEEAERKRAEYNHSVALNVIREIIAPTMGQLQHRVDSEYAKDQIIMPAIQELEHLRRASDDPRIVRSLSELHQLYAHHQDRLGLVSTEHSRIAVDLAKEYLATSSDPRAERFLASAYEGLMAAESTRGAWTAAADAAAEAVQLNQHVRVRYGFEKHPVLALSWYSVCLRKSCKIEGALLQSRKSLEFLRPKETPGEMPNYYSLAPRVFHAFTLLEQADWDEADKIIDEALKLVQGWSDDHTSHRPEGRRQWPPSGHEPVASVYSAAASVRNGQGFTDDAIQHARKCLAVLDLDRPAYTETVYLVCRRAKGHEQLSDAYALEHEWAQAEDHAFESIRIWETLRDAWGLNDAARGRFRLAQILVVRGREKEARRQLQMARDRMRQLLDEFPNDFYYVRQLLMLLTLSPLPEVRDVVLAARLAELDDYPDSQILSRYRALAFSSAGKHEAAKSCTQNITLRPTGGDTIDALIACIVYARAGDFVSAQVHYERAKEAIERGEPVHFLDCGPLVVEQLHQQADAILSRDRPKGA